MIEAIIFDMDGIIIDSEPIHSRAFETILRDYGYTPEFNEFGMVHKTGLRTKDNWELFKQKYGLDEDIEILTNKKRDHYLKILKDEIKPMPGLIELIKLAKEKGLKLAVASNSNIKILEIILEELDIKKEFDFIISGDFVENAKPHPEIYVTTARELKINPAGCIAIEDSNPGVESAAGAGMKVIAVPTAINKNEDFSKAALTVSSLEDINWDILSKL